MLTVQNKKCYVKTVLWDIPNARGWTSRNAILASSVCSRWNFKMIYCRFSEVYFGHPQKSPRGGTPGKPSVFWQATLHRWQRASLPKLLQNDRARPLQCVRPMQIYAIMPHIFNICIFVKEMTNPIITKNAMMFHKLMCVCLTLLRFCSRYVLMAFFTNRSKTDPITGAVKSTKYHQL